MIFLTIRFCLFGNEQLLRHKIYIPCKNCNSKLAIPYHTCDSFKSIKQNDLPFVRSYLSVYTVLGVDEDYLAWPAPVVQLPVQYCPELYHTLPENNITYSNIRGNVI